MSVSSDWGRAMVVSSDGAALSVAAAAPTHATAVARDLAVVGDPIRVRCRSDLASGVSGANALCAGAAAVVPSSSSLLGRVVGGWLGQREDATFWVPDESRNEVGLLEAMHRRGETNLTPVLLQSRPLAELQRNFSTCTGLNIDLSHNVFRLSKVTNALQQMHDTMNDMAQYSRNERTHYTGNSGALDGDQDDGAAHVSEAGRARRGDAWRPHHDADARHTELSVTVPARTLTSTMRAGLQALQVEDYYLVKYRDYSAWAVRTYRELAKRDGVLGRRYVEQCFVVHVGREPGELIPVTEAQFLFGVDLLQRQLLNELASAPVPRAAGAAGAAAAGGGEAHGASEASYAHYQFNINFRALNADQYRSLGVVLGDGLRPVGVEADERRRRARLAAEQSASAGGRDGGGGGRRGYVAPAWYDWSPQAIRTRVQHRLSCCYHSIGQMTVQVMVLAVCGFMLYRSVRAYLPATADVQHAQSPSYPPRRGRAGADDGRGGGGWYGGSYYVDDLGDGARGFRPRPGFWRSVFMGPKDVCDYLLAPS